MKLITKTLPVGFLEFEYGIELFGSQLTVPSSWIRKISNKSKQQKLKSYTKYAEVSYR